MPQRIGFTVAITLLILGGFLEAAITLTLATRPRLERILVKAWHR